VIEPVLFSTPTQLSWPSVTLQKNVYRGTFGSAAFAYNDALLGTVPSFIQHYDDPDQPMAPGEGYYYLIRGSNDCGEGP
jgi:hypothetical protein